MVEAKFLDLMDVLPPERRYKLMASRACRVSEARYIHYLLQCQKNTEKPFVKNIWVSRESNVLPILAKAIMKPNFIGEWEGESTAVVINSVDPRLHGMIVYAGKPLRPMRMDAIYPSEDVYMASSNLEGSAISSLARELGYRFEINMPIMDVMVNLLRFHQVLVGSEFWTNIDAFTQGLVDREHPIRKLVI